MTEHPFIPLDFQGYDEAEMLRRAAEFQSELSRVQIIANLVCSIAIGKHSVDVVEERNRFGFGAN